MSKVCELFGRSKIQQNVNWEEIVRGQQCPFLEAKCYKTRKSNPETSIGSCTVLYGQKQNPIIICPARLLERHQIFTDCLHLLTAHQPGHELHLLREVSIPGGSVDFFLASALDGRVVDFVGIELQTMDTTGTVWPERQRLLKELHVPREDDAENSAKTYGMNWKMTAKTILVQMHHKIETFERVNRKLVLVVQNALLRYITGEFNFAHLHNPPIIADSIHIHSYRLSARPRQNLRLALDARLSTDALGMAACLGLQANPRVELENILLALQRKISPATRFIPI